MVERYRVDRTIGGGYSVRQTDIVEDVAVGAVGVAANITANIIGGSIGGVASLVRKSRDRKQSKAVDDLISAAEREDFDALLRLATAYSQNYRDDPTGPGFLSFALAGKGQYGEAHAAVENAVRLGLEPSEAIDLRINIHYRKGDTAGLLKECSTLTQSRDRQWEGWIARARTLMQIGDLDLALSDANRAISLAPDEFGYGLRGDIYCERKLFAEAVEDYSRAIRLNPKNPDYFESRATAYEQLGKADEARADREAARRLVESKPKTSARTTEAVNFIVYLRDGGVRLMTTSAGELDVRGRLRPETRAKLENLKPELLDLLRPGNDRGAALIHLAWLRAHNVELEAIASNAVRVTRGRLSREDQAELDRLMPELVEILAEPNP